MPARRSINDDEINGNIALIQRTGCRFDTMVANAADAGAVAAIVYNIAGDPIVMHGESGLSDIPALMMGQADANLILAEFDAGNDVTVILDKGLLLASNDTGDDDGDVLGARSGSGSRHTETRRHSSRRQYPRRFFAGFGVLDGRARISRT